MNARLPAIRAYHVVFGAYGFWLPNDPRGSWSKFVAAWELFRLGPATTTSNRRSVAKEPHDRAARLAAKQSLTHPAVAFSGRQALAVAHGFARSAATSGYTLYACSILPDHMHLVVKRHSYKIEQVVRLLKAAASAALREEGLHPMAHAAAADGEIPSPWSRGCWRVYLHSDADVARSVRYVEHNPVKEGKPIQRWSFVTPFEPQRERGSTSRG